MGKKGLVNLIAVTSLLLSAYAFADTQGEKEQTETITFEELAVPHDNHVERSDQFAVICLKNNSTATVGFQWTDNQPHNETMAPGYWRSFYWNDTGSHSIIVKYDADTVGGSKAWKTYKLDTIPAPFPDCQYGNKYQFRNVSDRWIELYTGHTFHGSANLGIQ
jgi:hypothetical protein